MTKTTKIWAKNSSTKYLRKIKKDMVNHPTKWSQSSKTAINTEMKARGLKTTPKKRAKPYNPFGIPRGMF